MKNGGSVWSNDFWVRGALIVLGVVVLGLVYIFQRINFAAIIGDFEPNTIFVVNRTARLILNDMACFLIIFALFRKKKYLQMAFWVFVLELVIILPGYLVVKLALEGDSEISSPLLSQVHRLVVNPMLMILLIAGFFYQEFVKRQPVI